MEKGQWDGTEDGAERMKKTKHIEELTWMFDSVWSKVSIILPISFSLTLPLSFHLLLLPVAVCVHACVAFRLPFVKGSYCFVESCVPHCMLMCWNWTQISILVNHNLHLHCPVNNDSCYWNIQKSNKVSQLWALILCNFSKVDATHALAHTYAGTQYIQRIFMYKYSCIQIHSHSNNA